jgi:predicted nucleic acid-binding protein
LTAESFLLDTSALIAFIEDEAGADRVEGILRTEKAIIPWVALLEMDYVTRRRMGEAEASRRYAYVKHFPARILWQMDEPTLLTAARIKAGFKLSLADAITVAYARQNNAILVHKDPEFEPLEAQLKTERLPYKNKK